MKRALANFFLNIALALGAKRVTVNVIKDGYSQSAAEAILTAKPLWQSGEAKVVAGFLASPVGQSLSKRLRAVAAQVAIDGANDRVNTIHSAGVSAGWNECVRYLHSLSRVSGEQDTAGEPNAKDSQQPEDEAALVERLSP